MPKLDSETKKNILVAAEKVFHANGFKGTRTSVIAEEAGINRTMLHYHYSTKEALFEAVLNDTMQTSVAHLKRHFAPDKDLEEFIAHLIDVLSDIFARKPGLATFMVNIMNESPELTAMLAVSSDDDIPKLCDKLLTKAREEGNITSTIDGENLFLNIFALCCMPYLVAPYVKIKENRDDAAMRLFIQNRRKIIKETILASLGMI